jgi:membrane protein implicated in regulation of membrane protease activity
MTWADFYLICFAVGFLLSAISFIAGGLRLHVHLPHIPHGGALGHIPGGSGAAAGGAGQAAHVPLADGHAAAHGANAGSGANVSPFNFVTLTAFLAWFGGTGFLITRFAHIWFALGLLISTGAGLVGGGIVFLFLSRVLISPDENMDSADYEMVGVLGRTSLPIRESGTGEIIYSQAGTRRTCGARSENGGAIEKGAEIVVTRYEKGIAYVRLWEEMHGE